MDRSNLFPWESGRPLLTVPPGFERGARLPVFEAIAAKVRAAAQAEADAKKEEKEKGKGKDKKKPAAEEPKQTKDGEKDKSDASDAAADAKSAERTSATNTVKTKYQLFRDRIASEQKKKSAADGKGDGESGAEAGGGGDGKSTAEAGDAAERAAVQWASEIVMPGVDEKADTV